MHVKPHVKRLRAHYLSVLHGLCKYVEEAPYIVLGSLKKPCESFVMHARVGQMMSLRGM